MEEEEVWRAYSDPNQKVVMFEPLSRDSEAGESSVKEEC